MEWISVLSFVIGAVGLALALVQQRRIESNKKKDFRRYWDLAKTAHIVLARIEGIKTGLDTVQNCPQQALIDWGRSHESALQLLRMSLQNVFLQGIEFDEKEIAYWESTGLLSGYLKEAFTEMRLNPPKDKLSLNPPKDK